MPAEAVERTVAHAVFWFDSDADGLSGSRPRGATVHLLAGSPDLERGERVGAFEPLVAADPDPLAGYPVDGDADALAAWVGDASVKAVLAAAHADPSRVDALLAAETAAAGDKDARKSVVEGLAAVAARASQ